MCLEAPSAAVRSMRFSLQEFEVEAEVRLLLLSPLPEIFGPTNMCGNFHRKTTTTPEAKPSASSPQHQPSAGWEVRNLLELNFNAH